MRGQSVKDMLQKGQVSRVKFLLFAVAGSAGLSPEQRVPFHDRTFLSIPPFMQLNMSTDIQQQFDDILQKLLSADNETRSSAEVSFYLYYSINSLRFYSAD